MMLNIVTRYTIQMIIRWIARIGSIITVSLLLLFLFGEGDFSTVGDMHLTEWILLVFFPTGVIIGMITGWRWEWLGGSITVTSLLAFYGLELVLSGDIHDGPWFLILALPGILFLVCWLLSPISSARSTVHG